MNRPDSSIMTITLKYFEPGHTFMSADSFHAMIEKGIRRKNKLQDFYDLIDVVNEKGEALVLNYGDFLNVEKQVS